MRSVWFWVCLSLVTVLIRASIASPDLIPSLAQQGWPQTIQMHNSSVTLTVVPEIARIMQFSRSNSANIIWQDLNLTGQLADPYQTSAGEWRNFGGAKLWIAPQSAWNSTWDNWPPDVEIDAGPCTVTRVDPNTLVLDGQSSLKQGIQLRRQITLVDEGADFEYTLTNISDHPVSWGIWMVLQAVPEGALFLPATETNQFWLDPHFSILGATTPEDLHYQKHDQVYVLDHTQAIEGTKVFSIPEQGWLAYWVQDQVFFLLYEADPTALYPSGEGSTEIFTGSQYIELEHLGPLITLDPQDSTTLEESWRILSAPQVDDPIQQIDWVQAQATSWLNLDRH